MIRDSKYAVAVRNYVAKWLMRVNQSSRQLKIVFWGITALSTTVTATKGTFLADYTGALIAVFPLMVFLWAWFFDWSGLMLKEQQSTTYRKQNFLNPGGMIQPLIRAEQFHELAKIIDSDKEIQDEEIEKRMLEATEKALANYKDGIDLERFDSCE